MQQEEALKFNIPRERNCIVRESLALQISDANSTIAHNACHKGGSQYLIC
jgi:hypothetical protein